MEFGDYLRTLIRGRNVSVSSVARGCGIERTLLFRAMTGQRILPAYSLSELIRFLKLRPGEKKRLYTYYSRLFEEEDTRNSRKQIENLFTRLSRLEISKPDAASENPAAAKQFPPGLSVIQGEKEVREILQAVFEKEAARRDACLNLMLPPQKEQNAEIIDLASIGLRSDARVMKINQIFCFDWKDPFGMPAADKIDGFCQSFRLSLLFGQHYQPYYYYGGNEERSGQPFAPFPYFAVTHNYVVCMTQDKKSAMLLRDEEQISHYHRFFQEMMKRCYRFTTYLGSPSKIMDFYCGFAETDSIHMILPPTLFLSRFADTRIKKQVLSAIHLNKGSVGILRENFFPDYLSVCTTAGRGIVFFVWGQYSRTEDFRGVWIQEPNLCSALYRWLTNLFDGDLILTPEEFADIADDFSGRCQSQIPKGRLLSAYHTIS